MAVNKRGQIAVASIAAAIGAPSATIAKKRITVPEHSGITIVADLTNIIGTGTIRPNIYVAGPAASDARFGLLWKGPASDGSTTGIQIWQIYPQGVETAIASTAMQGRASLAIPEEIWIDWDVATQIVTFSAEVWLNV